MTEESFQLYLKENYIVINANYKKNYMKEITKEEILNSLPKRVKITQEIIDSSNVEIPEDCIGANLLKKVFPMYDVSWGRRIGWIHPFNKDYVRVTTREGIDMMEIKIPQFVTLEPFVTFEPEPAGNNSSGLFSATHY